MTVKERCKQYWVLITMTTTTIADQGREGSRLGVPEVAWYVVLLAATPASTSAAADVRALSSS